MNAFQSLYQRTYKSSILILAVDFASGPGFSHLLVRLVDMGIAASFSTDVVCFFPQSRNA